MALRSPEDITHYHRPLGFQTTLIFLGLKIQVYKKLFFLKQNLEDSIVDDSRNYLFSLYKNNEEFPDS